MRLLRRLGYALLSLVALLLLATAAVYVISSRKLGRVHQVAQQPVTVPSDSAAVREGARLAQLRGCGGAGGCHGENVAGGAFVDGPWYLGRLVAPDLTIAAREYSDAQLAAIIRRGVRPDGRSVLAMPSDMFTALSDEDLGRIIAWLRSLPAGDGLRRERKLGPLARALVAAGQFEPTTFYVREADSLSYLYPAPADSLGRGAYLARTVCSECHGPDLKGSHGGRNPDLTIAAGYSLDAFTTLLRTGKPLDGRDLRLMDDVARGRFSHFTAGEIGALHRFLVARAAGLGAN